jgi:isochorismate hydrolase
LQRIGKQWPQTDHSGGTGSPEAHVCVLQTALDLRHNGYQVYVVEDAICSRKAEHKFYALQRMQQQGITIINYESVLFEWLRDASHPHFRSISGLLR